MGCHALARRALLLSPLIAALLVAGCKKKEPEHVIEQRKAAKQRKRRLELIRKGKLKPRRDKRDTHAPGPGKAHDPGRAGHDHAHGKHKPAALPEEKVDTSAWPKSLKKVLFRLQAASPQTVPALAVAVAQHGHPGYEALRVVVRQKRQPKAKRAFCAMLIAEGHAFKPADLSRMGHEALLPYLQRAAIEQLALLKDRTSQRLLVQLARDEKPMASFIERANKRAGVTFNGEQLKTLDRLLNPKDVDALKKDLMAINTFELEKGLGLILAARGIRPVQRALIAKRLVTMAAKGDRQRLRAYAKGKHHPAILRVGAAQTLMRSRDGADRATLQAIANDPKDPMARTLKRLLTKKP
jgi:hypothetical protein